MWGNRITLWDLGSGVGGTHFNVRFYPSAGAAQSGGFRACKCCRPDATPGLRRHPDGAAARPAQCAVPASGAGIHRFAVALPGTVRRRRLARVPGRQGGAYRRTLRMPHGAEFALGDDHVRCGLRLEDLRDLGAAVQRRRRLLDLDADPVAVADVLGADPLLAPLVRRAPGRRVPGSADGAELAVRAVLGQQISVAGARTLAGELVTLCGQPLPEPLAEDGDLTHLFPQPVAIEDTDLAAYAMPEPRRDALRSLARALAGGEIVLDPGADREEAGRRPVDRLLR